MASSESGSFPSSSDPRAGLSATTVPSAFLPSSLNGLANEVISVNLERLSMLYATGHSKIGNDDDEWEEEYERKFAVQWLTNLVSSLQKRLLVLEDSSAIAALEALLDRATGLLAIFSGPSAAGEYIRSFPFTIWKDALDQPTEASAGSSPVFGTTFEVNIRDGSINSHSVGGATNVGGQEVLVGVQTWGSASILAQLIASSPQKYLSGSLATLEAAFDGAKDSLPVQTARILELGAGTGLVSLASARILSLHAEASSSSASSALYTAPTVELFASDSDPLVIDNLRSNISRNSPFASQISLKVAPLDWQAFLAPPPALRSAAGSVSLPSDQRPSIPPASSSLLSSSLLATSPPNQTLSPLTADTFNPISSLGGETFDVIFGADIVYEAHQAFWIRETVRALLKKPSTPPPSVPPSTPPAPANDARFHLVIPLRPTHEAETASVRNTFPSLSSRLPGSASAHTSPAQSRRPSAAAGPPRAADVEADSDAVAEPELELQLVMLDCEEIEPRDRRRAMRYLRCEIGWAWV